MSKQKSTINLLPTTKQESQDNVVANSRGKKILTYVALFGFLFVLALGGFYFYRLQTLKQHEDANTTLRAEAQSLEGTEQRLILIQNRIAFVQKILSERTTEPLLDRQETVLSQVGEASLQNNFIQNLETNDLKVRTTTSDGVRSFFDTLDKNRDQFTQLVINYVLFNPLFGYEISMQTF